MLSPNETKLLQLGLDFAPSPKPTPDIRDQEWETFTQNCYTAYNHAVQGTGRTFTTNRTSRSIIRTKPIPPNPPEKVITDLMEARDNLAKLRPRGRPNLPRDLRSALQTLKQDQSIIINKADKGSNITIQNLCDYIKEGELHLSDRNTYEPIITDPTLKIQARVNNTLKRAVRQGWIPEELAKACRRNPDMAKTQYIYFLIKTHKNPHQLRPIVSGRGGATELASALVDNLLQPHVLLCEQILPNSLTLINSLASTPAGKDTILFTADVKNLYTSIPQQEGIHTVLSRIYKSQTPPTVPKQLLRQLLLIILQDNVFGFNGNMYRQKRGVAMGTRCAPAFANLFVATIEDRLLKNLTKTGQPTPKYWRRYIDDIFGIWDKDEASLDLFLSSLNNAHHTLTFTMDTDHHSVNYLDLTISKGSRFDKEGLLDTSLFRKPCDTLAPLPFHSAHQPATFKGIFRGEVIRLLRNTSCRDKFHTDLRSLINTFMARGYPQKSVRTWLRDIKYSERDAYLHPCHTPFLWSTEYASLTVPYQPGVTRPQVVDTMDLHNYPFTPKISFKTSSSLLLTFTKTIKNTELSQVLLMIFIVTHSNAPQVHHYIILSSLYWDSTH